MEFYFEITVNSKYYDDYFKWRENSHIVNDRVVAFLKERDMEDIKEYSIMGDRLYILDTPENRQKYGKQLAVSRDSELVSFKKTSLIGREFAKSGIHNLEIARPYVPFFFSNALGKMKTRLFHDNKKLYCSIEFTEFNIEPNTPEGFIRMKASEFFKVIETIEEREAQREKSC